MRAPAGRDIMVTLAAYALLLGTAGCVQSGTIATPTPASQVPVVYFERPPSNAWQSVDWNGTLHGALATKDLGTGFGLPYQSPDGSRLMWPTDGAWWFIDRRARRLSVADLPIGLGVAWGVAWADDSSGICVLRSTAPKGHSYELGFISATGGSRAIGAFSTPMGPNVAACSPATGRVVITTASGYKDYLTQLRKTTFGELLIIDFKNGNAIFRQVFPAVDASTTVSSLVVSRNGLLAAVGTESGTTVFNLVDGQVVSHAQGVPLTFSWDGKWLAVVTGLHGELLNSDTGQIVWVDSEASRVTQSAAPNPTGPDLMFLVTYGGLNDLLVVGSNGTTRFIARDVFVGPLVPCTDCSAA